jgi:hypothetical protein
METAPFSLKSLPDTAAFPAARRFVVNNSDKIII